MRTYQDVDSRSSASHRPILPSSASARVIQLTGLRGGHEDRSAVATSQIPIAASSRGGQDTSCRCRCRERMENVDGVRPRRLVGQRLGEMWKGRTKQGARFASRAQRRLSPRVFPGRVPNGRRGGLLLTWQAPGTEDPRLLPRSPPPITPRRLLGGHPASASPARPAHSSLRTPRPSDTDSRQCWPIVIHRGTSGLLPTHGHRGPHDAPSTRDE